MSDWANVWSGYCPSGYCPSDYCPIGLLSYRVTVSRTTIPRANVRSGGRFLGCLLDEVSVGLVSGWATA